MTLQYYGMLGRGHSWSTVSQNLLLELQKQGVDLICRSTNKAQGIPESLPMMNPCTYCTKEYCKACIAKITTDVSLSYTIPTNLSKIPAKHKIVIANHDNTSIPIGWATRFNRDAHLILPSSQFAYDVLKENGVHPERMEVVPHGYDPTIFHPDVPSVGIKDKAIDDKFKFLMIAAPHWRKGHDIMLRAFIEEFKDDKDVALIIKCSSNDHEGAKLPFHVDYKDLIGQMHKEYKYIWPEIRLLSSRVESLAGLYKYADCTVLPTRAECFSLTMLESAMVKTPIITTDYGGHLDFLNHDNSYLIDYVLRKCPPKGVYYGKGSEKNSYLAEPDLEDFKRLLRHVKNNHDEAKKKAELCYEQNKHLTWANAATQILELIKTKGWTV